MPSPLPRTGEKVDGVSRRGSPALSSPPERGDGDEDEAGRMADRRGAALSLLVARWRCGGEVWRWHRPEPDGVDSFPPWRGCDPVSGWRWLGSQSAGRRARSEERGTGEEVGGILRPDSFLFALLSSLPFLFALFLSTFSLYIIMYIYNIMIQQIIIQVTPRDN